MKERELFSGLAAVPPVMVRLDGRAFHQLTASQQFKKPYDARFCRAMADTAVALLEKSGLEPVFAYTFSDEISLCFTELPFSGRVEKLDSVCASFAASAFTLALGADTPLSFDARIIFLESGQIADYLAWRQAEAWRNHSNAWAQQILIQGGLTSQQAAKKLKNLKTTALHELCFAQGVNLARTPAWQRRGILVCKETYEKDGYNPLTNETVRVNRNRVVVKTDVPLFSEKEGKELVDLLLCR